MLWDAKGHEKGSVGSCGMHLMPSCRRGVRRSRAGGGVEPGLETGLRLPPTRPVDLSWTAAGAQCRRSCLVRVRGIPYRYVWPTNWEAGSNGPAGGPSAPLVAVPQPGRDGPAPPWHRARLETRSKGGPLTPGRRVPSRGGRSRTTPRARLRARCIGLDTAR